MNIQNALRELLHKPGRKQPHISRQADQINLVFFESGSHSLIVLLAAPALGSNRERRKPHAAGGFETSGLGPIGNDHRDPGIVDSSRSHIFGDGLKVRPAPGEQDAEVFHSKSFRRRSMRMMRIEITFFADPRESRKSTPD